MMPTGIAVTKQATTKTMGNNTSSLNKHHNLRWQHQRPQQRRNNKCRPYILWHHWTTRCHQYQWHQHFSQSNRMRTKSISWSTVKQQHMSAHHGLRPAHPCTTWNMDKGHSWQQQQMKTYQCMGTNYKWVLMTNVNKQQLVVPFFVCEVAQPILSVTRLAEQGFNIQLNEAPTVTHTQRDSTQHLFNVMDSTSWQWSLSTFQSTCSWKYIKLPKVQQQRSHQSPWHQQVWRSWGTEMTSGHPTTKDIWSECTEHNAKHLRARPTVSSSHRKVGKLQKNNCKKKQWQQRKHWRCIPNTWHQATKENPWRRALDRRNMVQSQERNTPSWQRATNASVTSNQDDRSNNKQPNISTSSRPSNRRDEVHSKAATVWSNKSNWINFSATSNVSTTNNWLLDQRRTFVEKSTCQAKSWSLHSTTNRRWPRCHQAYNTTNNDGETNKWSKTVQDRWWLDHKETSNTWPRVDGFNKLWGEYKDEYITDDVEEQQEARKAKGLPAPPQPTAQERLEHELTHLPYRSWCPVCVQAKGRSDNHLKQHNKTPVIQCNITCYKAIGEQATSSIFTAIHVETGMFMAAQIEDKTQSMQYLSTCLQQFLMECGRTHAVLNSTVIQSDNEGFLIALLKATATAMGSNIPVRQSPTYTSQAQGSVERFHRTLMGQVRALKLQLENNYDTRLTSKHWNTQPTCWTGMQYMQMATSATTDAGTRNTRHQFVTLVKQFYTCCQQQNKCQRCKPDWLGKDTSTNENVLGITNKVVRSRTIRRQVKPEKYNKQLLHVINSTPMTTPTASSFVMLPTAKLVARPQTTTETQTSLQQEETFPTTAAQSATPTNQPPAITELPMATAPSTQRAKSTLASASTKKRRDRWSSRRKCVQATEDGNTTDSTKRDQKQRLNHQQQGQGSQQWPWRPRKDKRSKLCPMKMNKKQQQRRSYSNHGSRTLKDWTKSKQLKEWNKR